MGYQALYRVWRPQRFSDIVGQEHVTTTLKNSLGGQKISHAYLFSGPRGTGKTSAAKVFAKTVNCERAPISEPCNECATCIGITDGTITDVIEIDAASNNGVDEIRDIRDKVKYAPSVSKYKVYIIDEVHMLTTGAYNALLKTLEEPPAHVIFILATTEPHRIPLTVISRCQRFDFKRITTDVISARIRKISDEMAIEYEEEALSVIARAAEGGMRDALSLLDQAVSFGNNNVTVEDVLTITGTVSQNSLSALAKSINNEDVGTALTSLDELFSQGKDPARFIEDLIFFYRDMLLYKTAPNVEKSLNRSIINDEFEEMAKDLDYEQLYYYIEVLNKTQQEMKWTNHPRVFLEVMIVKLCQGEKQEASIDNSTQIQQLKNKIADLEKIVNNLKLPREQGQYQQERERPKQRAYGRTYEAPVGQITEILKEATKEDLQIIRNSWGKMLQDLDNKQMRADTALLQEAMPVAASPQGFIIQFKHEIHCQMAMDKEKLINNIKLFYNEQTSKDLVIIGAPEEQWQRIRQEFIKNERLNTPNAEADEQVEDEPILSEAKRLFGADLVEIKQ